jgi:hypothetical protein
MSDAPVSSYIKDPELRMIAETHELDAWKWGTENPLLTAAMMEGAAIAIRSIYDENRDVTMYVHQSGTMQIWGGAYFQYQINPNDEAEVDHVYDWDDDPVVKQYECKNVLTLSWVESVQGDEQFEAFFKRKTASLPAASPPPD